MKRRGRLFEKVRNASLRAVVAAGVIGLLTLNGLIGAAAYGYAFAAAMTDPDDDSDDDRN